VPVWHERTKAWRESGMLAVIGITQEQHPERCALFAQWQGIDWPILWDPLNLNGSSAVPLFTAIDEYGVVRSTRPRPDTLENEFLYADFEQPSTDAVYPPAVSRQLLEPGAVDDPHPSDLACAHLLWGGEEALDAAISELEALAEARPEDHFRRGVAYRMRTDSPLARDGDFQAAVDGWRAALTARPNQYIWRRRLQQYGPRLDKPYPFYDWVQRAQDELRARGQEPVALRTTLTGSEVATALRAFEAGAAVDEPDPEGRITRDEQHFVDVEVAVTFHTAARSGAKDDPAPARVHVGLRPRAASDAHWNNEAEPLLVWVDVPQGWQVDRALLEHANPPVATSSEIRRLDFELRPPADASGAHTLKGYALFNACEGEGGTCVYRRRDFEVRVEVP
jgi:hypothetical protein